MKKLFLLTIALIISSLYSYGAYIKNHPVALTQPDGSIINCFASGDEFYSFLHTQEGYVMQEGEDGFYYFAEKIFSAVCAAQQLREYFPVAQKQYPAAIACRERIMRYHQKRGAKLLIHIHKILKQHTR